MKIVIKKTDDLIPYINNARTHDAAQVAQIAGSIEAFGFNVPVLVDGNNGVIAGHGRLLAAQKLGLDEVPTIELRHLSESQKRAFILADNRLGEAAGWDKELLKIELSDLQEADFDLALTGFTEADVGNLAARDVSDGLTGDDDLPEDSDEPVVSCPGDIWVLGEHRLVCGDCTDADTIAPLMETFQPVLMVTDPPYGVAYDAGWRNEIPTRGAARDLATDPVVNDHQADWSAAWNLYTGPVAYVWHAGLQCATVANSLAACGFLLRAQIIWAKNNFAISRGHYHYQHEPCFYVVRKGATGNWTGDHSQTTLWSIESPKHSTSHSTQKPLECMLRPIQNNSRSADAVYEPFSGSGTTLIACEKSGRRCLAVEIHPPYVDMAIRRWQAFTGGQAVHVDTQCTFDELSHERPETCPDQPEGDPGHGTAMPDAGQRAEIETGVAPESADIAVG